MGAVRRLARLIWGDDVDRALRPVLGVTLVASAAGHLGDVRVHRRRRAVLGSLTLAGVHRRVRRGRSAVLEA
jgi:hypothetical protein